MTLTKTTEAEFIQIGEMSHQEAHRLVKANRLERVAPAVYLPADASWHPLAEAAGWSLRYENAVICLLTAAVYYDLTDAFARGIWLAVPRKSTRPRSWEVPLHAVEVRPDLLDSDSDTANGIDAIYVHGSRVRITGRDRTVLDLWKYRTKIPSEYALVALKRRMREPDFTYSKFARLGRKLRVWSRVGPVAQGLRL
ncbi:MAG: putative transcriptional regulator of viral defense system [Bradymonadia bacterium]